jgi:hypothetical protein
VKQKGRKLKEKDRLDEPEGDKGDVQSPLDFRREEKVLGLQKQGL